MIVNLGKARVQLQWNTSQIDKQEQDDSDLLNIMGIDASKWAEEFCKRFGNDIIDEGLMLGWFANAIEAGRAAARREDE